MNFQRIMPNKINMGRGAELSQREQVFLENKDSVGRLPMFIKEGTSQADCILINY